MSFVSTYNNLSVRGWENNANDIGGSWSLSANLTANNSTSNSHFGQALDMSFDNTALAISQEKYDGNTYGSLNIYFNTGNGFITPASTRIVGPAANCFFGQSLSISNNATYAISTAIVANTKRAYIYGKNLPSNTYSTQANLSNPYVAPAGDSFGTSVSIDGTGTYAVVTSPSEYAQAYIYTNTANSWSLANILSPTSSITFGYASCINASGNILVITDLEQASTVQGNAYVYTRSGNAWTLSQTITNPDSTNINFGHSVSIDSLGQNLIIGATGTGNNQGTIYFYTSSSNVWSLQQRITANNTANGDQFGYSISISGSGNLIAGSAPNQDVTGNVNTGSVYIFTKIANNFYQTAELFGSPTSTQQFLGSPLGTVAIGDYSDSNILNTTSYMAAGAGYANVPPSETGVAFVYTRT
jgi:hypothetical protein